MSCWRWTATPSTPILRQNSLPRSHDCTVNNRRASPGRLRQGVTTEMQVGATTVAIQPLGRGSRASPARWLNLRCVGCILFNVSGIGESERCRAFSDNPQASKACVTVVSSRSHMGNMLQGRFMEQNWHCSTGVSVLV